MPLLLEENELADQEADALDAAVTDADVQAEEARFAVPMGPVGDLSRGGRAGQVNVYPNPDRDSRGRLAPGQGRATARRAWMWDGTETVLTLGWNPEGTEHNGARPYLAKKHCHCCGFNGFRLTAKNPGCLQCAKNQCPRCQGGRDKSKVIPLFYLRRDKVPFPRVTKTDVDCCIATCWRRDGNGFKDEPDMRFHARTKHRQEYQSLMESQAAQEHSELQQLRAQVTALTLAQLQIQRPTPEPVPARRAARRPAVAGTPDRPLYVKE